MESGCYSFIPDNVTVPGRALFGDPIQSFGIDPDQTELLGISPFPFKIVQDAPDIIPLDVGPFLDGFMQRDDMCFQKTDSIEIVNKTILVRLVYSSAAIFCQVDLRVTVIINNVEPLFSIRLGLFPIPFE